MQSFIESFYNIPFRAGFAALCSVVGLGLSIWLLFFTSSTKKAIQNFSDIKEFNEKKLQIKAILEGHRRTISQDDLITVEIISLIREQIYNLESYNAILSRKDKNKIKLIHEQLDKGATYINKQTLCNQLSYFISKMSR